jgi:DNA-nicking Smr family endonuclease
VRTRRKIKGAEAVVSQLASPFGEPVLLPVEDSIDLHTFQPKDVPSVLEEYLQACKQAGLRELRIIHGKGIGVQRNIVRSILERHPDVAGFRDASPEAGGWGATIVVLSRVDTKGSHD